MPANKSSICVIAPNSYHLCKGNWERPFTGVDLQLFNWAKQLQLGGFQVEMVVGDFGQPETEEIDGIILHRAAPVGEARPIQGLANIWRLARALRRAKASTWLMRGTGPLPIEVWMLSKLFSKKLVTMVASDVDVDSRIIDRYGVLGKLYLRMLTSVPLVVVQNEYQQTHLEKRKGPIVLIPNSLPDEIQHPKNFEERSIDFLWVGSTHAVKRPQMFLDFAKANPSATFLMILGVHNKKVRNTIVAQAKTLENCQVVEDAPYPETFRHFQNARWYCMTSEFEGFANTLVQAMMCGTPTISTSAVNPLHLYSEKRAGIIVNEDTFSNSAKVAAKENWAELSQRTREVYLTEFNSEKLTRVFISHLEKLNG